MKIVLLRNKKERVVYLPYIMRIFLLFFLSVTVLICNGSAGYAGDTKTGELINNIREYNRSFSVFSSRYVRDIITKSMSLLGRTSSEDKSEGIIYVKPPHNLKVVQEAPSKESLIATDEDIVWYIAEKNEAHIYRKEKFGKEFDLLIDLFTGLEEAFEDFIVNRLESRDGNAVLELTPDPPWQEVARVEIYVSDNRRISSIRIYNHLDTLTYFNLEEFRAEEGLNNDFFRFTPPFGAKIIADP